LQEIARLLDWEAQNRWYFIDFLKY